MPEIPVGGEQAEAHRNDVLLELEDHCRDVDRRTPCLTRLVCTKSPPIGPYRGENRRSIRRPRNSKVTSLIAVPLAVLCVAIPNFAAAIMCPPVHGGQALVGAAALAGAAPKQASQNQKPNHFNKTRCHMTTVNYSCCFCDPAASLRSSSGSLAKFTSMRRASSWSATWPAVSLMDGRGSRGADALTCEGKTDTEAARKWRLCPRQWPVFRHSLFVRDRRMVAPKGELKAP